MNFTKQIVGALTATIALLLMASVSVTLTGCDTTVNEADTSSTTTTINNPEEQPFDATGTVSGRVIDRVTSAPIEGATVAIDAVDSTVTTDAAGSFRFSGVPATSDPDGSGASGTYNVHITTPEGSSYRSFYTAEVRLTFGIDDVSVGSGPGNNLGASVTFPLAKLNGTINGSVFTQSAFTGDRIPTAGEEIVLYQDLALRYDDDGGPIDNDRVRVASTQTEADGSFTFENVEEAADFDLEIVFAGKEGEFFAGGTIDPETGGGSTVTLEPVDVTSDLPDFNASLVSPSRGADLGTAEPAFVIAFSTPVAENDYTTPGEPLSTSGTPNISNDIFIDASATTAKARNADGEIAVDLSFNSTRDTLTITPVDPLEDGTEYELEVGGALFNSGDGFVNTYGQFINTGTFGGSTIDFSIGVNEDTPDAPAVAVTDVLPENRDYGQSSVTANLEFTPGANSVPLREYEIYRRTADTDDDDGFSDDEFELVGTIDATNTNFGVIAASNTASSVPFYGDDGGDYEPIAWRFRAISINGVPSDFSSVIEVGDNVGVGITSAQYVDQDFDGTDDALRMNFDEPISSFPTDASTFVSIDGADAPSVGDVIEVDSNHRSVLVEISGGTPNPGIGGDEVEITSLDDFAGNGVDTDQDVATIF